MSSKLKVKPDSLPVLGSYSHAIRIGKWLYISGQVSIDSDGRTLYQGDVQKQARVVFDNIKKVLSEAGGAFSSIIKITAFLIDQSHYPIFNNMREEYFPEKDLASTAVVVSGLVNKEWLIEIEAVAYLE